MPSGPIYDASPCWARVKNSPSLPAHSLSPLLPTPRSELSAVPPLARLLSAPDVQAQVCASGALLNIVGPDLDRRETADPRRAAALLADSSRPSQRRSLGRLMALAMAAAAIYDCVYEQAPPLPPLPES